MPLPSRKILIQQAESLGVEPEVATQLKLIDSTKNLTSTILKATVGGVAKGRKIIQSNSNQKTRAMSQEAKGLEQGLKQLESSIEKESIQGVSDIQREAKVTTKKLSDKNKADIRKLRASTKAYLDKKSKKTDEEIAALQKYREEEINQLGDDARVRERKKTNAKIKNLRRKRKELREERISSQNSQISDLVNALNGNLTAVTARESGALVSLKQMIAPRLVEYRKTKKSVAGKVARISANIAKEVTAMEKELEALPAILDAQRKGLKQSRDADIQKYQSTILEILTGAKANAAPKPVGKTEQRKLDAAARKAAKGDKLTRAELADLQVAAKAEDRRLFPKPLSASAKLKADKEAAKQEKANFVGPTITQSQLDRNIKASASAARKLLQDADREENLKAHTEAIAENKRLFPKPPSQSSIDKATAAARKAAKQSNPFTQSGIKKGFRAIAVFARKENKSNTSTATTSNTNSIKADNSAKAIIDRNLKLIRDKATSAQKKLKRIKDIENSVQDALDDHAKKPKSKGPISKLELLEKSAKSNLNSANDIYKETDAAGNTITAELNLASQAVLLHYSQSNLQNELQNLFYDVADSVMYAEKVVNDIDVWLSKMKATVSSMIQSQQNNPNNPNPNNPQVPQGKKSKKSDFFEEFKQNTAEVDPLTGALLNIGSLFGSKKKKQADATITLDQNGNIIASRVGQPNQQQAQPNQQQAQPNQQQAQPNQQQTQAKPSLFRRIFGGGSGDRSDFANNTSEVDPITGAAVGLLGGDDSVNGKLNVIRKQNERSTDMIIDIQNRVKDIYDILINEQLEDNEADAERKRAFRVRRDAAGGVGSMGGEGGGNGNGGSLLQSIFGGAAGGAATKALPKAAAIRSIAGLLATTVGAVISSPVVLTALGTAAALGITAYFGKKVIDAAKTSTDKTPVKILSNEGGADARSNAASKSLQEKIRKNGPPKGAAKSPANTTSNLDSIKNPDERKNVAAFLDVIGESEGAGYNTLVGKGANNSAITDLSAHPNVVGLVTGDGPSTAAGKYQITGTTWRSLSHGGNSDFSPASQDAAAIELLKRRGAYADVVKGDFDAAVSKLGNEWQSLPSGTSKFQGKNSKKKFDSMMQRALSNQAKMPSAVASTGASAMKTTMAQSASTPAQTLGPVVVNNVQQAAPSGPRTMAAGANEKTARLNPPNPTMTKINQQNMIPSYL